MFKCNKTLIFLLLAILFCSVSVSYAAEVNYPTLGAYKLGPNSTLVDVVAYYFNFSLIIGIVATVIVVAMAGFNMASAQGSVSILAAQKTKIINGFWGLLILLSSYIFLNYINPDILNITNPKIDNPSTSPTQETTRGICLVYKDENDKDRKLCKEENINNISNNIVSIEWKSNSTDLPSVDVYTQADFKGEKTTIQNGTTTVPVQLKSVFLNWRQMGAFLYRGTNYNDASPYYATSSLITMPEGLSNNVESIKFLNPADNSYNYGAILFGDSSYSSSNCAWIVNDASNLGQALSGEKMLIGQNSPALGNNKLGSMILIKVPPLGSTTATLYNRINCQTDLKDNEIITNEATGDTTIINTGECGVSSGYYNPSIRGENQNISKACPYLKGDVVSIKLEGLSGILLRSGPTNNPGRCQFFKKPTNSTCINVVKYGSVYDQSQDPPITPKSFTLIPLAGD